MDLDEKIYAHILSVWKEPKEFFGGRSLEGMLILTDKHLMFVRKTEAKMRWWGAGRYFWSIDQLVCIFSTMA